MTLSLRPSLPTLNIIPPLPVYPFPWPSLIFLGSTCHPLMCYIFIDLLYEIKDSVRLFSVVSPAPRMVPRHIVGAHKILAEGGWGPDTWHATLRCTDILQGGHFTETRRGQAICPRSQNQGSRVEMRSTRLPNLQVLDCLGCQWGFRLDGHQHVRTRWAGAIYPLWDGDLFCVWCRETQKKFPTMRSPQSSSGEILWPPGQWVWPPNPKGWSERNSHLLPCSHLHGLGSKMWMSLQKVTSHTPLMVFLDSDQTGMSGGGHSYLESDLWWSFSKWPPGETDEFGGVNLADLYPPCDFRRSPHHIHYKLLKYIHTHPHTP